MPSAGALWLGSAGYTQSSGPFLGLGFGLFLPHLPKILLKELENHFCHVEASRSAVNLQTLVKVIGKIDIESFHDRDAMSM